MSLPTATPSNLRIADAQQNCKLTRCSSARDTPLTMNSIAFYVDSMRGKCSKCYKSRVQTGQPRCSHRKHKSNQPLAVTKPAQSAIELVVNGVLQ